MFAEEPNSTCTNGTFPHLHLPSWIHLFLDPALLRFSTSLTVFSEGDGAPCLLNHGLTVRIGHFQWKIGVFVHNAFVSMDTCHWCPLLKTRYFCKRFLWAYSPGLSCLNGMKSVACQRFLFMCENTCVYVHVHACVAACKYKLYFSKTNHLFLNQQTLLSPPTAHRHLQNAKDLGLISPLPSAICTVMFTAFPKVRGGEVLQEFLPEKWSLFL